MALFRKFNCFLQDLGRGLHNLHTDTLRVLLTNTAPSVTDTIAGDLTEIADGNGYTAGGVEVQNTSFTQTGGLATLYGDDVVITASGGGIGPFRYAILLNDNGDSGGANPLIGWWDYGSSITLAEGENFTINTDGTNGIFTLT